MLLFFFLLLILIIVLLFIILELNRVLIYSLIIIVNLKDPFLLLYQPSLFLVLLKNVVIVLVSNIEINLLLFLVRVLLSMLFFFHGVQYNLDVFPLKQALHPVQEIIVHKVIES